MGIFFVVTNRKKWISSDFDNYTIDIDEDYDYDYDYVDVIVRCHDDSYDSDGVMNLKMMI
ncbi:hypothetical protein QR98_0082340 [Sarcoptes scabiei]|uniref:Uncharacterized protein n=1 Tax=Sarcoptes scabiei TaxID=52283 RepID=A0A132AFC7_SARSC|nr:hypothetical protein QR98_0082340 [Sarcoptes scabiei]